MKFGMLVCSCEKAGRYQGVILQTVFICSHSEAKVLAKTLGLEQKR